MILHCLVQICLYKMLCWTSALPVARACTATAVPLHGLPACCLSGAADVQKHYLLTLLMLLLCYCTTCYPVVWCCIFIALVLFLHMLLLLSCTTCNAFCMVSLHSYYILPVPALSRVRCCCCCRVVADVIDAYVLVADVVDWWCCSCSSSSCGYL